MSKTAMKKTITIPVQELQTIRLVCKRPNCGGVAEFPTSKLAAAVGLECPSCHQAFVAKQIGGISGLKALGMGIDSVSGDPNYEVEFVVPAPE